jgi:hypothetical protein
MAKRKEPERPLNIPKEAAVDLSAFDWGGEKLTRRQKLFVAWFCTPGTDSFRRAARAARKAGYTKTTAATHAYKIRKDPKIDRLIKRFEETIGKTDLIDTAKRWLHEKIIRGGYDVKDFFRLERYTDPDTGEPAQKLFLKNFDEMTPEQRLCIDGIDVKGQKGAAVYLLPDRERVRDFLIQYCLKEEAGADSGGYDVETLTEIIKGEVQVKTRVINRNQTILEKAGGFYHPSAEPAEEE